MECQHCVFYAIFSLAILYFLYETLKEKEEASRKKLIAAFIFILFYRFLFYEQSGGSLALFAKDNLRNNLLFFEINPNIVNNTSNSFFVIILVQ
jgi:POT family proton-dependent oligopeptide transporter